MIKNYYLYTIIILNCLNINSQNICDSLLSTISANKHDTSKARFLYEKSEIYSETNPYKTIEILNKAYALSSPHNNHKLTSDITNQLGYNYYFLSDYNKSLKYFIETLKICEKTDNKLGIAASHNNIGTIFLELSDTNNALKHHFKSLNIRKSIKPIDSEIRNLIAMSTGNVGKTYFIAGNYEKAMEYFLISYNISKEEGNKKRQALMLNNIGGVYGELNKLDDAYKYFNYAYELYKELDSKENVALCLNNIAEIYARKKEYQLAINKFNHSLKISSELSSLSDMKTSYDGLYNCYLNLIDYKMAHDYLQKSNALKDSIFNENNTSEINNLLAKFDTETKEKEIKLLQADQSLKESQIKNAKIITYSSIAVIILISAFAFYIFYMLKQKQRINHELGLKNKKIEFAYKIIDEKQTEILDSINYAKRIQYALLANEEFLQKFIPNHFVLFKPKDIVSGDFYWAATSKNEKNEELFYLACCDSTGHGVPGAFMSLLSIGFLSEAIKEKNIHQPNLVFDYVRNRLIDSINNEQQKDGFDGILICYNLSTYQITYAAANNNPVIINSQSEIINLPYDKMPVGKTEQPKPFNLYEISAEKDEMIYLFTDGYADQFGGEKGKKFKYKQLNELLKNISQINLETQKHALDTTIENWRNNLEQVDDILVIGFKI